MTAPRSVRFDAATETRLLSFVARRPGLSRSSAAALLVEEGLRMDAHPGVVFRDGPAGRRAVLVGGPDVWEVVRAIRLAKLSEPELGGDDLLALVSDSTGLRAEFAHMAVAYYSDYPEEVDALIEEADRAEAEVELAVARRHELLGA
jgi:hypothetical protein